MGKCNKILLVEAECVSIEERAILLLTYFVDLKEKVLVLGNKKKKLQLGKEKEGVGVSIF